MSNFMTSTTNLQGNHLLFYCTPLPTHFYYTLLIFTLIFLEKGGVEITRVYKLCSNYNWLLKAFILVAWHPTCLQIICIFLGTMPKYVFLASAILPFLWPYIGASSLEWCKCDLMVFPTSRKWPNTLWLFCSLPRSEASKNLYGFSCTYFIFGSICVIGSFS